MNAKRIGLGILDTIVKVVFIVIVAMLIIKYAKVAYGYGYHIFNQTAVSSGTGRTVTVTISNGDGAEEIADKLASAGLITDKTLFRLQELLSEYHGKEQPGTYELSTSMTPDEMLGIMAEASSASDTESAGTEESTESGEESSEEIQTTEETSGD